MRLILAGVLALPSFAQGPFTEAVTAAYERVKLNLVETAAAMPEEYYEFRLKSAAETVLRVADPHGHGELQLLCGDPRHTGAVRHAYGGCSQG